MNNIEKIHELLDMALFIQTNGCGQDGYPFVAFETSNYGQSISVRVRDKGFGSLDKGYDGVYNLDFCCISERTYQNCKQHLTDLREKVKECITMNAPSVERI